jgi:ABC-type taurine transport system substrate-binding protein
MEKIQRIIAGAASRAASFVVRNDAGINSPKDFAGKKLPLHN